MNSLPIQIVDKNDQPLGAASIEEAQTQGLIHRIVRVMIEDDQGRVLLQKRLSTMTLYPNCWDNSAAGHVDFGESYDLAARRELGEEIGLTNVDLQKLGYYQTNGTFESRKLNRFNRAYKVVVPVDTKFKLQADEVSAVQWFTVAKVKQLLSEHPDQVTDGLVDVFERFY